jgi:arylsulfate sulfotransferase
MRLQTHTQIRLSRGKQNSAEADGAEVPLNKSAIGVKHTYFKAAKLLLAAMVFLGLLSGCRHASTAGSPSLQQEPPIGTAPWTADGIQIAVTANPQVARYTIRPQRPADVEVQFGTDTNYGLRTWTQPADGMQPVSILVAGMRADTTYHLRAVVHFRSGGTVNDTDHTFTTGHLASQMIPPITVRTTPGATPQPGVELLNPAIGSKLQLLVTDLHGNVLWGYDYADRQSSDKVQFLRYVQALNNTMRNAWNLTLHTLGMRSQKPARVWDAKAWKAAPPDQKSGTLINPAKMLPNGNLLLVIGPTSQSRLLGPEPPRVPVMLREIDLTGRTVRQLDVSTLNNELHSAGYNLHLDVIHHDVAVLPNGHWIVLANTTKLFSNLPGRPGVTEVVGDALVDLDPSLHPVWVWNEFDHLDVNRHPMDFPDWTHTNAVIYTKDDGNLIVSMRCQSWLMKIDYRNGKGSGNVLWRMGRDGDLKLLNGSDPTDWTYGQHDPEIDGERSAGIFRLSVMDNGNNRVMQNGGICGTPGNAPCYSTVSVYEIDENAKTAKLVFHHVYPPSQYSIWGGSVTPLANGNLEADLCYQQHASNIYEITTSDPSQVVWQLHMDGTNIYRSQRLGSLYPNVQW